MKKGIVVRLYPTKEQQDLINKSFGCARLIYNTLLDYAKDNKDIIVLSYKSKLLFLEKITHFLTK